MLRLIPIKTCDSTSRVVEGSFRRLIRQRDSNCRQRLFECYNFTTRHNSAVVRHQSLTFRRIEKVRDPRGPGPRIPVCQ